MERLLRINKFPTLLILIALVQMQGYKACLEKERIGLLELKSFFISINDWHYADEILTSWVDNNQNSNCCDWERVKCNTTTQRVMQLSLNNIKRSNFDGVSLLNFSLFLPFEELQSLDLTYNNLGVYENKVVDSFGSLEQLEILKLGDNRFNDNILPYLNTLTSLNTLILHDNKIEGLKPKQGLVNLKKLQLLDLTRNRMTIGFGTRLGLANLTNLKILQLPNCGITAIQGLTKLKNLEVLDLSYNYINNFLENQGAGMFTDLTNLEVLYLRDNNISVSITWLGLNKLKNLKTLDLSYNNINGSLENQGICGLKNIFELDLRGNKFEGAFPQCLNNLTHLKVLEVSSNQLSGNLTSVDAIATSLEYLDLIDNHFEGIFPLSLLANHSNLKVFLLSTRNNTLHVKVGSWIPTFQLKVLRLSNCNLNVIPSFLFYQYDLYYLDLSHNKLVGNFPIWLLQNNTKLDTLYLTNNSLTGFLKIPNWQHDLVRLDISQNNFTGMLPENMGVIFQKLLLTDLSKNNFEGNIPSSIGEMKIVCSLNLSRNKFSGQLSVPLVRGCCSLMLLDLSFNNFHGQIFPKYMKLTQLNWLYLNNNSFSGQIEDGLLGSTSLLALDISNNMLSGHIPQWMGNFSSRLFVLLMSKNMLEGNIPIQLNNLEKLEILDISENNLSGMIPSFNISSVKHLYLQKNALSGLIPDALFRSSILMTLILGDNNFSGKIPHQINEHSALRVLILRKNYLQGLIPTQLCQLQNLSIIDLSSNILNGSIPSCLSNVLSWRKGNDALYGSTLEDKMGFSIGSTASYYESSTLKLQPIDDMHNVIYQRVEVEFGTKNRYEFYIGSNLDYMAGMDLSCNEFTGEIPSEIGELQAIRGLNFSHNFFFGSIPKSFSNLKMIESLDFSYNKLSGEIPPQLIALNFLSNFNVSYNNLSGPTPDKGQFGTFDESSYRGNVYLCGSLINEKCSRELPPATPVGVEDESAIDMEALKWTFGASYVTVILGFFVVLWINSYWRRLWFYFIDGCIDTCYYWFFKYVFHR